MTRPRGNSVTAGVGCGEGREREGKGAAVAVGGHNTGTDGRGAHILPHPRLCGH